MPIALEPRCLPPRARSRRLNERTKLFITAALAFMVGLIIYLQGTAPSVVEADTAELQSVALIVGLVHPTGYPTFVMLGRLFALLPFSDHAYRINFMSSFLGALALGLMVILLRTLGLSLRAAFAGALLYGFTYTFWDSALRAGTRASCRVTWSARSRRVTSSFAAVARACPREALKPSPFPADSRDGTSC